MSKVARRNGPLPIPRVTVRTWKHRAGHVGDKGLDGVTRTRVSINGERVHQWQAWREPAEMHRAAIVYARERWLAVHEVKPRTLAIAENYFVTHFDRVYEGKVFKLRRPVTLSH